MAIERCKTPQSDEIRSVLYSTPQNLSANQAPPFFLMCFLWVMCSMAAIEVEKSVESWNISEATRKV